VFGVGICSLLISGPDGWRAVAVAEQFAASMLFAAVVSIASSR